ncbi:MAG TPA: tetratricopeptide repeat protein [Candidatus Woesebacteria bacterium]|nr:tetratricopeptide repeat protein [Candidatus Woesebacteria bacterium]
MNNDSTHDLQQEAIKASVSKNWAEAIKLNEKILETYPEDISTLNRLGTAYSMVGKNKKAQNNFEKVIKIDPHNPIAKNNIQRLKSNKSSGLINPFIQTVSFIEEPGKSKVIPLVSQAEPKIFSTLNIGEPVELSSCKHKVKVSDQKNIFIGYLPDNISHRLLHLLKAGYKYKTVMKSVNSKTPQVFIQEIHITKRLKGIPSFPLDENELLPSLSAGESSEIPPLEIYDPLMSEEA